MPLVTGGAQVSASGQIANEIILNEDISPTAAIARTKLADVSATSRVIGRKSSGAGADEELTLSEVLDFIGSAAQGDILFRDASAWAKLAAGTSGMFLKTLGAGANPAWATVAGGFKIITATRAQNGSNGAVNYAHGMGRTPSSVFVFAMAAFNSGGTVSNSFSIGAFDGTSNKSMRLRTPVAGAGASTSADGTNAISMLDQNGGTQVGVITVDGTNITVTWTQGGSPETESMDIIFLAF